MMENLLQQELVEVRGGQTVGNPIVKAPCKCNSGAAQSSTGTDNCECDSGALQIDPGKIEKPGCICVRGAGAE